MGLEEMIKRLIVTAAEIGAQPNNKQLDSYETYAKHWKAEVVVIPIQGQQSREEVLADRFSDFTVTNDMQLSKHLAIRDYGVKAQTINPLTGLRRFGTTKNSIIVGSPKQHLEHVANSSKNEPKAVMSTGVSTLPNYRHNRIGRIGLEDHVQGAIAIELDSETGYFYQRQIQNISDGSFIDMGVKYSPNGKVQQVRADTMVIGDMHNAQMDKSAYETTCEQINTLKPKYVMLHDIFDGYSVSHHDGGKFLLRGKKAVSGQTDLYTELHELGKTLEELTAQGSKDTKFMVVKSNHDEVIDRYLEECRFVGDERNLRLSVQLANAYMEGKDPLEEGVRLAYGHVPKNIKFLKRDDDFNRYGWHLSSHGDKGPSGSRGSMASFDYSLGKAIVGHNHSAAIRKNVFRVGTIERMDVDYVKGTTGNWTNTNAVIYPNGRAQLITSFGGKWNI